jgi:hypothetical protein
MLGKYNKINCAGNRAIPMWYEEYWGMPSEELE